MGQNMNECRDLTLYPNKPYITYQFIRYSPYAMARSDSWAAVTSTPDHRLGDDV
jgi:hypothetical protein